MKFPNRTRNPGQRSQCIKKLFTTVCSPCYEKRKEDQDQYRNVQSTKKGKTDKKAERVTPTK
eukprot:3166698-Heterocapsa_arctica.AAC.1